MADPRLAKIRSASLSDAMRKLRPHVHHAVGLSCPAPGRVVFGPAATLLFAPVRSDVPKEAQDFEGHARAAAGAAAGGKVLVCASPWAPEAAVVGGVRLALLERLGFAGVVTTGRIRDPGEAASSPLGVFCRGDSPMAGSAVAMPVATGIPIGLDGATVLPGDWVYADGAGVVVVPAADRERALDLAVAIEAEDARRASEARGAP